MKTMFLSTLAISNGYVSDNNGFFEMFIQAFIQAIFDLAIFVAIVGAVVFVVMVIIKKVRECKIAKALKSESVVLTSLLKIDDLFYQSSEVGKYFDFVEVITNRKVYEAPLRIPVKITKLRLNGDKLKVYVDIVEQESDFEVLWIGKSYGEKPLGDDAIRVSLENVDFGSMQVSRQKSGIPESAKEGDKVKMRFTIVGNEVNLLFVSKL